LVLHLGCGLDSRCERVERARTQWVDLDMPDVIALRSKFFAETETYHMIASSVTDLSWKDKVSSDNRAVLVVAEGLLMYLYENDVKALILSLHQKFPGCEFAFDAFSKLTADRVQAHPSLQKTGAAIHWGIDDPHEIERWADGINLKEEWFFSQEPDLNRLSWFYRFMFRLTGSIQAANRAHRLLYFTL
jgi:O-methyltransferase involved in polyketide biosynthesis